MFLDRHADQSAAFANVQLVALDTRDLVDNSFASLWWYWILRAD